MAILSAAEPRDARQLQDHVTAGGVFARSLAVEAFIQVYRTRCEIIAPPPANHGPFELTLVPREGSGFVGQTVAEGGMFVLPGAPRRPRRSCRSIAWPATPASSQWLRRRSAQRCV